jgi:DNA-binding transcriptional regulator GbsR (MarR family)
VLAGAESPMTISEIIKAHEDLHELSTQKVSPLISSLVKEFKVVRIEEKRKAYFKIA